VGAESETLHMTKKSITTWILDDDEVRSRVARGELVRAPAFGEPPIDPHALAALRARVAAYKPPRRRKVAA
jgi:hypothetical protein